MNDNKIKELYLVGAGASAGGLEAQSRDAGNGALKQDPCAGFAKNKGGF
jgi:hypothetical protein